MTAGLLREVMNFSRTLEFLFRKILERFVTSPSIRCLWYRQETWTVRNPLMRLTFDAPSDGDGDLPQVDLQLRDFLKS